MDVSIPCGVSVSECINSSHDLMQPYINHNHCTSNTIGDSSVVELGNALTGILCIQDVQESLLECGEPDKDKIWHPEGKICGGLKIDQAESSIATTQKGLMKCATFPCSKKTLCDTSVDGKAEMPGTVLHGQSCMESGNSACTRTISLPTPLKLVSAIKGGREKHGTHLKKLTVTWAPDVYDPPATSLSHTVKSRNQQRSRTKKKNGKHKHKSKSSRGSSSDKKQYRRTIANTNPCSSAVATSEGLPLGGFNQSNVEHVDFAVGGQDSNCGSSFLRTSMANVHISVAEAK